LRGKPKDARSTDAHVAAHQLRCPYCVALSRWPPRGDRRRSIDYGVLACAACAYPSSTHPPRHLADEVSSASAPSNVTTQGSVAQCWICLRSATRCSTCCGRTPPRRSHAPSARCCLTRGRLLRAPLRRPDFVVADAVTRGSARLDVRRHEAHGRVRRLRAPHGHALGVVEAHQDVTPTLLDRSFWRLWSRGGSCTRADVICCDASAPLPCRRAVPRWPSATMRCTTSGATASHVRTAPVTAWAGAVVITHAHSALGENATAATR